jgi:glyoxylate reductase
MSEVAVTAPLPGPALGRLARRHNVRVRPEGLPLSGRELAQFAGGAEALITLLADGVDADVFAACPRLKVVANYAVGVNNIDLAAAAAHRVWVTNTPDVLTEATADLAWALLLAVARRVIEGDRWLRAGRFRGWKPDLLLGSGLQGKTLGIVGMGRIGRAVAQRALPFGMCVAAHDPGLALSDAPAGVELVAALDDLLPRAHVLSLHCPLTPATRGLMNARRLRLLPHGAILINTSRGEVVDEAALTAALADGHLGGAGLDVYEREPEVHPGLLGRDDVVLLPHLGSATVETRAAMAELAVDNVLAVLDGVAPPTPVVTPQRGGVAAPA